MNAVAAAVSINCVLCELRLMGKSLSIVIVVLSMSPKPDSTGKLSDLNYIYFFYTKKIAWLDSGAAQSRADQATYI